MIARFVGGTQFPAKKVFTTEAQSSQRSENFLIKNRFTLRPPRLRGAISEFCFT
jgi:hypothetical protein